MENTKKEQLSARIFDGLKESYDGETAECYIETAHGFISVSVDRYGGKKSVEIGHNDHDSRPQANLESYVMQLVPDWREIEDAVQDDIDERDVWKSHGFENEAAYNRYRFH